MPDEQPEYFSHLLPLSKATVQAAVRSIVRIRYHYQSGTMGWSRAGTAFFLHGWTRTLLTAAHNVRQREGERPKRVELTLLSHDTDEQFTVFARAYAYPEPWRSSRDVAVILLPTRADVRGAPKDGGAPAHTFDGDVLGIPVEGGPGLRVDRTPVRAQQDGSWLSYLSGATEGGSSGGPLLWHSPEGEARAVGVHLKRAGVSSPARSWALDLDVVTACREAALAAIPKKVIE